MRSWLRGSAPLNGAHRVKPSEVMSSTLAFGPVGEMEELHGTPLFDHQKYSLPHDPERSRMTTEDMSRNLLRAQSAASRVPPKILTYVQVCSGFRLPRSLQPGLLATISGHILSVRGHLIAGSPFAKLLSSGCMRRRQMLRKIVAAEVALGSLRQVLVIACAGALPACHQPFASADFCSSGKGPSIGPRSIKFGPFMRL